MKEATSTAYKTTPYDRERVKVLVVDDDDIIGELLKFMLELNGYDVLVSNKPGQTLQTILNNDINLILLDKLLMGIDGAAICTSIKENEALAHVPVLMMSAQDTAKEVCMRAGADGFIAKPFDKETLFLKIERVLSA